MEPVAGPKQVRPVGPGPVLVQTGPGPVFQTGRTCFGPVGPVKIPITYKSIILVHFFLDCTI